MTKDLVYLKKLEDGVAEIVINRPEKRNCISKNDRIVMKNLFYQAEDDEDINAIILRGEGDHFCSGADLKQVLEGPTPLEAGSYSMRAAGQVIRAIQTIEKPVIAMVNGYAINGGFCLALACDMICAAPDAKMYCNFTKTGLMPEMGALLFMPMTIGMYKSKELWYTGEEISGTEAKEMGFVNRLFEKENLYEETLKFAKKVAAVPIAGARVTKRLANSFNYHMLNALLECEVQSAPFCGQSEGRKKLNEAFNNKTSKGI